MKSSDDKTEEEPSLKIMTTTRARSRSQSIPKSYVPIASVPGERASTPAESKGNSAVALPKETFASIAARPPSPKATKSSVTEAATVAATADFAAMVSKHRADYLILLASTPAKQTPAQVNRLRVDNVALMTSATIRVQQAGGTHISLERLYEIARDKEKAAKQLHDMALVTTALKANGLVPTMSNAKDAEGFKIVDCRSSSPSGSSPKPNIPPAIKGQVG